LLQETTVQFKPNRKVIEHELLPRNLLTILYFQRSLSPEDEFTSKRQKKLSMDPFDSKTLHEDVYCYITQHLDGKDVLAISEVSTTWNQIAENKIGDKVHLKLDLDSMKAKDFSTITQTSRAYKKVSLASNNNGRVNVICELSTHAEEMEISVIHREEQESFPNLKILDLNVAVNEDSWILKSNMNQLEKLKLNVQCSIGTENDPSHVHGFLAKLENLKHFELSGCNLSILETLNVPAPFQLEYLRAPLTFNTVFMDSQRQNLQTLVISQNCCKTRFHQILVEFPDLKNLEAELCDCTWILDDEDGPIPVNSTIKELKLRNVGDDEFLQYLLPSLPALVSLEITWLSIELIEFIAQNLHQLEKLTYQELDEGTLERYEEMKNEEIEGVNKNIQCHDDV
jgi:hypothetical protein